MPLFPEGLGQDRFVEDGEEFSGTGGVENRKVVVQGQPVCLGDL